MTSLKDDVTLCRSLRMIMLSSGPPCTRCMSLTQHHIHRNRHKRHSWVIDSGASVHCVSDHSLLTSVYYKHHPVLVKVADNRTLHAHAVGTAILPLVDQHNRTHSVTLLNVIYPLSSPASLSPSRLIQSLAPVEMKLMLI